MVELVKPHGGPRGPDRPGGPGGPIKPGDDFRQVNTVCNGGPVQKLVSVKQGSPLSPFNPRTPACPGIPGRPGVPGTPGFPGSP